MRKLTLLLLLLFLSFNLSAEVYKTTKEITAYKNNSSSSSSSQDVENITLTLLDPTQASFDNGTDIAIPESYRSNAYTAFYWSLSGNLYGAVNIEFKFGPMFSGSMSIYSIDSTITDQTTVIPYSVTLSHSSTTVTDGSDTVTAGTSSIRSADSSTALDSGETYIRNYSTYTIYINYADSITVTNPASISTASKTGSISYNMSTNSYSWYYRDNRNRECSYSSTTCNDWTRTGYATVTLNIDDDGVWSEDSSVVVDAGDFKAYVIVTVSTD